MVRDDYDSAWPDCQQKDLFAWTSYKAVARMCFLALTSEGWSGHETFNCVAPTHCWEGTVEKQKKEGTLEEGRERAATVDLLRKYWPNGEIDEEYFKVDRIRSVWDSTKAEKMLGWKHDEA